MKKQHIISTIALFLVLLVGAFAWYNYGSFTDKHEEDAARILELTVEVDELKEDIDKKRDLLFELRNALDDNNRQLDGLRGHYRHFDEMLQEISTQLKNSKQTLNNRSIEELAPMLEEIEENVENAHNQLTYIVQQEEEVQREAMTMLSSNNTHLSSKYKQLKKQYDRLNEKYTTQSSDYLAAREKITRLRKDSLNQRIRISKLEADSQMNERVKEEYRTELKGKDQTIDKYKDSLGSKQHQYDELNVENIKTKQVLERTRDAINIISVKSFKATYTDKKRKNIEVTLDEKGKHKSSRVKEIDISFTVGNDVVKTGKRAIVLLELYDSEHNLVNPSYYKDLTIINYQGHFNMSIDPPLDKGVYYFKVSFEGKTIKTYAFKIS